MFRLGKYVFTEKKPPWISMIFKYVIKFDIVNNFSLCICMYREASIL